MELHVSDDVRRIVVPAWITAARLTVVERDPRMDEPMAATTRAIRELPDAAAVTAAVRAMYRQTGVDPTKTRPSSEALLRRVRRGEELPRVNNLVDVVNWCSLEFQLPYGLYDLDQVRGDVTLRLGRPGEEYAGIRKDVVHLGGRLVLADESGPFGNPTSDSARTRVTAATTSALVVIFGPADIGGDVVGRAMAATEARLRAFGGARDV